MDYGKIEIRNDGTAIKPNWTIESRRHGYIHDAESLDDAVAWVRKMRSEGHDVGDGIELVLED